MPPKRKAALTHRLVKGPKASRTGVSRNVDRTDLDAPVGSRLISGVPQNTADSEWINSSDTHLFTDASGNQGFGAFFMGRWANGRWPNEWVQNGWTKDITMLELFPIVLAVRLWGRHLRNKRVLFVCDNQAVVAIINKQTAKPPRVMSLLRRLILLCLQHNILFKASYIPTHANVIADALSRFQWSRFKEAAPRADEIPAHIPQDIWQI
ncbi:uncharacterized protein [Haliotis cracherodii]|uniref:uncharacterized protein n=1 Tax=Haliotis cracherodii TaxID=6455 RepID=UPI0039E905BC